VRELTNRRLTARIRDSPDLASLRQIMRQYEGGFLGGTFLLAASFSDVDCGDFAVFV
jgi:hypothetical protein